MKVHFTTFAPIKVAEQVKALESWREAADRIVAINHEHEAKLLKHAMPEWIELKLFTYPRQLGHYHLPLTLLGDVVRSYEYSPANIVTFAPADVSLKDKEALKRAVSAGATLVCGALTKQVTRDASGVFALDGFELFALRQADAKLLDIPGLYVGMPWWTMGPPVKALCEECTVLKLADDAAGGFISHRSHEVPTVHDMGAHFVEYLSGKRVFPENGTLRRLYNDLKRVLFSTEMETSSFAVFDDSRKQVKSAIRHASEGERGQGGPGAMERLTTHSAVGFINRSSGERDDDATRLDRLKWYNALKVQPEITYNPGKEDLNSAFEDGWSFPEKTHRWTVKKAAGLLFRVDPDLSESNLCVTVDLRVTDQMVARERNTVKLLLNGQEIGSMQAKSKVAPLTARVPTSLLQHNNFNRLEIVTEEAAANSGDSRSISAMCTGFRVHHSY